MRVELRKTMWKAVCLSLLALTSIATAQEMETLPFDHPESGFTFQYPASWKVVKKRDHVLFQFTVEGKPATLGVFGMEFKGEIPTWQAVQTNIAKQEKRELVRQWQEEILTVPMLMSRMAWSEKDGTAMTMDIAMIYADTRRKLLFRLSAPSEVIEKAYEPFRALLQSLKTEDGKLPKPFDASKPQSENLRKPDRPEKRQVWTAPKVGKAAPVKGDQTIETTASNIALLLRYFAPWRASAKDLGVEFELPGGPSGVRAIAYSVNESDPAGKALIKASGRSLQKLSGKIERYEEGPITSKAGASYAVIWRTGDSEAGPMVMMDAVVLVGDYYVLLYWESTDVKNLKLRDQVMELVHTLSIEVKPGS